MKVSFFPKTRYGKWSFGLFITVLALLAIFYLLTGVFGMRGGDTFFSNVYLTIPVLSAWLAGGFAFVTGMTGIWQFKERGIVVFVSMIAGFLVALFGIMEIVFPH